MNLTAPSSIGDGCCVSRPDELLTVEHHARRQARLQARRVDVGNRGLDAERVEIGDARQDVARWTVVPSCGRPR